MFSLNVCDCEKAQYILFHLICVFCSQFCSQWHKVQFFRKASRYLSIPPRLKLTLPWLAGFPARIFYPSESTRRVLAVHLVTVSLLAAAWTAAEVSVEEGNYASRFYRWFSGSCKSCLLFLVAPPDLIDTLAQLLALRSLLRLSMTW